MSASVFRIITLASSLLQSVPIGTNLALFHVLWTLLSGRLLASRGALIPALAETGLPQDAVRRAWSAFAYGHWQLSPLVDAWHQRVRTEGRWRPHHHGGYRPVACDLLGFFRPRLRHCATTHFSQAAGQTLPAIPFGILVRIGAVGTKRVPLPCLIVRADVNEPSEATLQRRLLAQAAPLLAQDEVLICDRGFPLSQLQEARVPRFVARVAKNFTARRGFLPQYPGRGRPATHGEIVRPLPRRYKGRTLAATSPDRIDTWIEDGQILRAHFWDDVVRADGLPGDPTFTCVVLFDPRYPEPWVLVSPLSLSGAAFRALYLDRWPVEQVPLAAKQMLGAVRQFVFAPESRQRLPELSMLAGALLMYAAATEPAAPSGFWDRAAQPTIGRLRRLLARADFPDSSALPAEFRKKASPTSHLPKGILGHRRHRPSAEPSETRCLAA
jgi:hypothetical protein